MYPLSFTEAAESYLIHLLQHMQLPQRKLLHLYLTREEIPENET